jgi:hypothetical protein
VQKTRMIEQKYYEVVKWKWKRVHLI